MFRDKSWLISLAIVVAFVTSWAGTLRFFDVEIWWELAILITIMLLGHWLEMPSMDVAIAIGAGTDVAVESAGIMLVRRDSRDVVGAIELSRASHRKMIRNLVWATGYNVLASLWLLASSCRGASISRWPSARLR